MAEVITVCDLYDKGCYGNKKAFVVEDFPDTSNLDGMQNYIEVVTNAGLAYLCTSTGLGSSTNIVAVLDEVKDISKIRNKQFGGKNIHFKYLGDVEGVFVMDLGQVPEDTMELYFDNKRSGGIEGTVHGVKYHVIEAGTVAVVLIDNKEAIQNILSRGEHKISLRKVRVEPYFPAFHDPEIKRFKQYKQSGSPPPPRQATYAPPPPRQATYAPPPQRQATVAPQPPRQDVTTVQQLSRTTGGLDSNPKPVMPSSMVSASQSMPMQLETYGKPSMPRSISHTPLSKHQSIQQRGPPVKANPNKLCIFEDETPMRDNETTREMVQEDTFEERSVLGAGRSYSREDSFEKRKKHGKKKGNRPLRDVDDGEKAVKEENIGTTNVVLLKIGGLQKKCKEENVEVNIILQEKHGLVTFKAASDADITKAKLVMHEMLDKTKQKSLTIRPKDRAEYLARSNVQGFMRTRARTDKIGVVFEMNVERMLLHLYAYFDGVLEKGEKLFNTMFTTLNITLREGQHQLLQSQEWLDCKTKSGSELIGIYEAADEIIIETVCTMKKEKIWDVRKTVTDFLKSSTPINKAVIAVNGGQAKYFQKYCWKELEDKFRQNRNVKLYMNQVKQDLPIQLEISVEGANRYADEVKGEIKGIWHERIDFQRIASEKGDIWLMMRSLDGDIGRKFFRDFQQDNKCVIEVVRDGETQPTPFQITRKKTQQAELTPIKRKPAVSRPMLRESSEDTDDEIQAFHANKFDSDDKDVSPVTDNDEVYARQAQARENYRMYQPKMREEDLMALAQQMSYEEAQPKMPREAEMTGFQFGEGGDASDVSDDESQIHVMVGQTRVILKKGTITREQADVLVNILDPSGEFPGQSIVSKAFKGAGGQELVQMYKAVKQQEDQQAPHMIIFQAPPTSQNIVQTQSAGHLQCASVIHVTLRVNQPQVIGAVLGEIFQECHNNGHTSIAMPPLGVGRLYKYSPDEVARQMFQQTSTILTRQRTSLQEVIFVVYEDDQATYQSFHRVFVESPVRTTPTHPQRRGIHVHRTHDEIRKNRGFDRSHQHPRRPEKSSKGNPANGDQLYTNSPQIMAGPERPNFVPGNPYQQRFTSAQQSQYVPRPLRVASSVHQRQDTSGGVRRGRLHSSLERKSSNSGDTPRSIKEVIMLHRDRKQATHKTDDKSGFTPETTLYQRKQKVRESREEGAISRHQERSSPRRHSSERDQRTRSEKPKQKPPRQSRFSVEKSTSNLQVTVFSRSKGHCEKARNDLGKKLKEEFLHEIQLEKRPYVSTEAKEMIVKVIEQQKVKSVKRNGTYRLRGYRDNVNRANGEILKILLEDKPADPHHSRKQKKSKTKRATTEFAKFMFEEDPEAPKYWQNYQPGVTMKSLFVKLAHAVTNKKYEKVDLDPNKHTYKTIVRLINKTFEEDSDKIGQGADARGIQPYRQIFVHEICRIENLELYQRYVSKRGALFRILFKKNHGYFPRLDTLNGIGSPSKTSRIVEDRELGEDIYEEVNEKYFFHGTDTNNISKICSDGMDSRLCSPEAMFGQGIYGAESVVKADQYTDTQKNRSPGPKKMFLMRMLLGNIFVCDSLNPHKYKRPPCTSCKLDNCTNDRHSDHFDSVVGGMSKLFREFVVYDSHQSYPEYLITYERR